MTTVKKKTPLGTEVDKGGDSLWPRLALALSRIRSTTARGRAWRPFNVRCMLLGRITQRALPPATRVRPRWVAPSRPWGGFYWQAHGIPTGAFSVRGCRRPASPAYYPALFGVEARASSLHRSRLPPRTTSYRLAGFATMSSPPQKKRDSSSPRAPSPSHLPQYHPCRYRAPGLQSVAPWGITGDCRTRPCG